MSQAINRLIKRTLQNEYRRQTLQRSGVKRPPRPALARSSGSITIEGQHFPATGIVAASGQMVSVRNVGRPASALYAPDNSASVAFTVGAATVGGGGGGGGGGGPVYTAGLGIAITGAQISTKIKAVSGLSVDNNGIYFVAAPLGGLVISGVGVGVGEGKGIDTTAGKVNVVPSQFIAANGGLTVDGSENLLVKIDPAGGLYENSAGVGMNQPDDLTYITPNATGGAGGVGHTHNVISLPDVGGGQTSLLHAVSGGLGLKTLTMNGNIGFIGGDRVISASASLTMQPTVDLRLSPDHWTVFEADAIIRTQVFNDFVAGIQGFAKNYLGGQKHILTISDIKVDNLFAKKFTADEARVQRGEWFLTKSFGIVETRFQVPSLGGTVDVWFEEAPGLGSFHLFDDHDWVEFRTINWSTSLVIQSVFFQVSSQGTQVYITREAQSPTGDVPSRQLFRLIRRQGGFTGTYIEKGETGADFGLPRTANADPVNTPGQGTIYASSLYEPDFGPYMEVQTFERVQVDTVGGVTTQTPIFQNRVRMGNLQTVAGYSAPAWGFAAADDLSKAPNDPTSPMSGFTIDTEAGARFYNTDLTLYSGGIAQVSLMRDFGLTNAYDNPSDQFDPLRMISWVDTVTTHPDVPVDHGLPNFPISYVTGYHDGSTRGLSMVANSKPGTNAESAQVYIEAASQFNSAISSSRIDLRSNDLLVNGGQGAYIDVQADHTYLHGRVWHYDSAYLSSDLARVQVTDVGLVNDRKAGITIEAQGPPFNPSDLDPSANMGDAVLHWRLRNASWQNPATKPDMWFSAGIDGTYPYKWRLSGNERLGSTDYIVIDPSSGEVTINGWSPSGSTPPSGLTGGDGIHLAGTDINVDGTVARTFTSILAGNGLQGGGDLGNTRTLTVRLQTASGLIVGATGIAISDSLAGAGLTMNPTTKVLSVNPSTLLPGSTAITTTAPITGGGLLNAGLTLGLALGLAEPGLMVVSGRLLVDPTVVRTTQSIFTNPGSGLTGGGLLSGNLTLAVDAALFVSTSVAVNTPTAGGLTGGGPLSSSLNLQADFTKIVSTATAINTTAPLTGGGLLSGDRTLALTLANASGLSITGGLNVADAIAGTGLKMSAAKVLSVDALLFVPTSRLITAGNGLTGTGTLLNDILLNVGAGAGILSLADEVAVDQGFAFHWTGNQIWDGTATFNSTAHIVGAATLDSTLLVTGAATFNNTAHIVGAAALDSTLFVGGAATLNNTAHIVGAATLDSSLYVAGAANLHGVATFFAPSFFEDAATFDHNATFNIGVVTFNTNPKVSANIDFIGGERNITTASGANLNMLPAGDLVIDPGGLDMLPGGSGRIDIGDYNRKWGTVFATELYVETLVASSVMATIGGRVMVAPTTYLINPILTTTETTIDLKHNIVSFTQNTFLYMESAPGGISQIEAMKITGASPTAIVGPPAGWRYTVQRGVNPTGAKTWGIGDAVVSLGDVAGDGYIEQTSVKTILQQLGPTVTVYSRYDGAAWDHIAPVATMGNLSSFLGLSDGVGFAAGNDLTKGPATGFEGVAIVTGSATPANNGVNLYNTGFKLYVAPDTILSIDKTNGLSFKYGSAAFNSIGWYSSLGAGGTAPTGLVGEIKLLKILAPYSELDIVSTGVAGTWPTGAVKLCGQNSAGDCQNLWIDDSGFYFGMETSGRPTSTANIKNTQAWFAGNIGVGLSTIPGTNNLIDGSKLINAAVFGVLRNTSPGVAAAAAWQVQNNSTAFGSLAVFSSAFTPSGPIVAGDVAVSSGNAPLILRTISAQDMRFATTDAERMRITAAGLVGIGTNAPATPLDIQASIDGDVALRLSNNYSNAASADDSSTLLFSFWAGSASAPRTGASISAIKTGTYINTPDRSARLAFSTSSAGVVSEAMTILPSNFVGIGAIDPIGQLEVLDTTGANAYRGITNTQINSGVHAPIFSAMKARGTRAAKAAVASGDYMLYFQGLGWDGASWINPTAISMKVSGAVAAGVVPGEIGFWTAPSGAGALRMVIDSGGIVGIGPQAASATSQLHVWNNQNASTLIVAENDATTAAAQAGFLAVVGANNAQFIKRSPGVPTAGIITANDLMIYNVGTGDIAIRNANTAGAIKFANGAGTVPQLYIDSTGNVGIGPQSTSGTTQLSVWNNQATTTGIVVRNDVSDPAAQAVFYAFVGANAAQFGKRSPTTASTGIIAVNDTFLYNGSNGDIAIRNGNGAGGIKLAVGTTTVPQLYIDNSGNLGISSTDIEPWASTYRAIEAFRSSIMFRNSTASGIYLNDNAYYDGAWKFKAAAAASYLGLAGGSLVYAVNNPATNPVVDVGINWLNALVISPAGVATFSGSAVFSAGLNFGGDNLVHYDENPVNWVPVITTTGTQPTVGYGSRQGRYTRIGNQVSFQAWITISSYGSGTGSVRISLPIAPNSDYIGLVFYGGALTCICKSGQLYAELYASTGSAFPSTSISAGTVLYYSGVYYV